MRIITFKMSIVGLVLVLSMPSCKKDESLVPKDEPSKKQSALTFELTNLPRNSMLISGTYDDSQITVEGKAGDSLNTITGITINNTSVTLNNTGDCTTFSAEMNSIWGLNIIDGNARNELDDEITLVQSYLRSPVFNEAPVNMEEPFLTPHSWELRLLQDAFDDRNREDLDDIATLLELVINGYDFDAYFPDVIYNGVISNFHNCLFTDRTHNSGTLIERNGALDMGAVTIDEILVSPGAVEINLDISASSVPFKVTQYADFGCLPPYHLDVESPGIYSFSRIDVNGMFNVSFNNAKVVVSYVDSEIDIIDPDINIQLTGWDWFDSIISAIVNFVSKGMEEDFEDTGRDLLEDYAGPIIAEIINGITINPAISIPPPVNLQLNVNSVIDKLTLGSGYMDLDLATSIMPDRFEKDAAQLVHGSIRKDPVNASITDVTGTFGVAMKDDFINQVLWAVWAGGGFDLDDGNSDLIDELLSNAGLNATIFSIETGLPPVLMDGDNESEVKIGIGEILLKAEINPLLMGQVELGIPDPVEISTYVSLIMSGTFAIDPYSNKLSFFFKEEPEVHVQIEDYIKTSDSFDLENKFGVFAGELLKRLFSDVLGAIDLPSIPIGEIEGVPEGTSWILKNSSIDYSPGYHRIVGELDIEEK